MGSWRGFLKAMGLSVGYVILSMGQVIVRHLEYAFFLTILSMGIMIIVLAPDALPAWDEETHFGRAYTISFHKNVEYTQSILEYTQIRTPCTNTAEERGMLA